MIDQIIEKYDVVLGSKSPRRKELLQKLIPTFKIIAPAVKEDYRKNKSPNKYVPRIEPGPPTLE